MRTGDLLVRFEIPSLAADTASKRAEIERARPGSRTPSARRHAPRTCSTGESAPGAISRTPTVTWRTRRRRSPKRKRAWPRRRRSRDGTSVRATFDGLVAKRSHNPGDLVEPGAADPVLRVIDPHRLEVAASVPFADVPANSPGAVARVSISGPPGNGEGGLTRRRRRPGHRHRADPAAVHRAGPLRHRHTGPDPDRPRGPQERGSGAGAAVDSRRRRDGGVRRRRREGEPPRGRGGTQRWHARGDPEGDQGGGERDHQGQNGLPDGAKIAEPRQRGRKG